MAHSVQDQTTFITVVGGLPSEYPDNGIIDLTLIPSASGRVFNPDDKPRLTRYTQSGVWTREYFELSPDNLIATIHVDLSTWNIRPDSPIALSGTTIEGVPPEPNKYYTDISNVNGCSFEINPPIYYEDGDTINLKLVADSGTMFDDSIDITKPAMTYTKAVGGSDIKRFVVSTDKKTATLNVSIDSLNLSKLPQYLLEFWANTIPEVIPEPKKYQTVVSLNNCSSTPIPLEYSETDTIDITLTVDSGFTFQDSTPYIEFKTPTTQRRNFTLSPDKSSATINVTVNSLNLMDGSTIVIFGNAVSGETGMYRTDITNVTGCTFEVVPPEFYNDGDVVDLKLVANPFTKFDDTDEFTVPSMTYRTVGGGTEVIRFTLSQDKLTATLNVPIDSLNISPLPQYVIEFWASTIPTEPQGRTYGAINVYEVTLENLDEFALKRFTITEQVSQDSYNVIDIDLAQFVNRLKRIYTLVPTDAETEMKVGNYGTGILVKNPSISEKILDFGEVLIPEKNGDNTDNLSEIKVMLPFKGFVDIPNDYIGKKIRVEYVINIITGLGIVKLYCDGIPFHFEEVEPSTDIIYLGASEEKIIGGDKWNEQYMYGFEPYVYYKWYESENLNKPNNDNVRNIINQFNGFVQFEHVSTIHNDEMHIREVEEIYRLLENGVYIE